MMPPINTIEDIEFVLKHKTRWKQRQRIKVLRKCVKRLRVLAAKGIDRKEIMRVRPSLVRLLKRDEQDYKRESGKSVDRIEKRPEMVIEKETDTVATPAATKLALEWGVPLVHIEGTGQNGRILVEDVKEWQQNRSESPTETQTTTTFTQPG